MGRRRRKAHHLQKETGVQLKFNFQVIKARMVLTD